MARNDPIYKLVYFDLRGLAEPARLIFAYANVEYEDSRVKREDWPNQKAGSPFGRLPYLEIDGDVIGQSNAICRILSKRFNLAGHDDLDQARVDALVDYVNDTRNAGLLAWFTEGDKDKKLVLKEKYFKETAKEYLLTLEKHLKSNHGGTDFFVGNTPTWADFAVYHLMSMLTDTQAEPTLLVSYPLLKAHQSRVENLKGIKEWIAKRPKTPM